MVAQGRTGLAEGDNFSVSGRVGVAEVAVPAATDDLASVNDDGSHGDLVRFQPALCCAQSFLHPKFVGGNRWSFVAGHSSLVIGHRYEMAARLLYRQHADRQDLGQFPVSSIKASFDG
jgi:hypothetical protein